MPDQPRSVDLRIRRTQGVRLPFCPLDPGTHGPVPQDSEGWANNCPELQGGHFEKGGLRSDRDIIG